MKIRRAVAADADGRQRGSAMTELLICLAPYAMVLLGTILLGHLALARQEVEKSIGWTGPKPLAQTEDEVRPLFFTGISDTDGRASFQEDLFENEEQMDAYRAVSETEEEPVLPYDWQDVQAGVTRSSVDVHAHASIGVGGKPQVSVSVSATRAGAAMEEAGLVDLSGVTGTQTVPAGGMQNVNINFPVDQLFSEDLAWMLGSWLRYSRSESGYRYKLPVGGGRLPLEGEGDDAGRLRQEYELTPPEDEPDAYAFYTASRNEAATRGGHHAENVDLEAMEDLHPVDVGGALEVIAPEELLVPVLDRHPVDKDVGWDPALRMTP